MFIPANGEASPAEKADITVDGNRFVSYTNMFVYLGSRITHTLSDSTDLSARIGKGWGAFFKAKPVLLNKHISMDLRINLFKSLVLGQVLWGCESWALTGGDRDALDTFLHQALRSMFNLRMYYIDGSDLLRTISAACGAKYCNYIVYDVRHTTLVDTHIGFALCTGF